MTSMCAFLSQVGAYIDVSRDEMIARNGTIDAYLRQGLGLDLAILLQLKDELLYYMFVIVSILHNSI